MGLLNEYANTALSEMQQVLSLIHIFDGERLCPSARGLRRG